MRNVLKCAILSVLTFLFLQVAVSAAEIDVTPSLSYSDINCEAVLLNKGNLRIDATVKNNKQSTRVSLYVATYNASNKLVDLKTVTQTINSGATATLSYNYNAAEAIQNNWYVKAFVWETDNMKPHMKPIVLTTTPTDFFGNTIESATQIDITKPIEGRLDSLNDTDFVKFTPTQTAEYIIQTTGNTNPWGYLCTSDMTTFILNQNLSNYDSNFFIRATLTAGKTYYVMVTRESNATGAYKLSIEQNRSNMTASVAQNYVLVKGNVSATIGNSKPLSLIVIDSTGTLLITQSASTSSTGNLDSIIQYPLSSGKYRIVAMYNDKVCEVLDLDILTSTKLYSLSTNDYASIPVVVSNAKTLSNVEFSLSYDSAAFDVYDICENTSTLEVGAGQIPSAYVNITNAGSNYITFKSTRTTPNWSGIVNIVKLKSKRNGTHNVWICTYQMK